MPRKSLIDSVKTIVVKIGSSSITENGIISKEKISRYVLQVAELKKQGYNVALVTSGAISTGAGCMDRDRNNLTIPEKQALASVGQMILVNVYRELFEEHGLNVGQILLTEDDIKNRRRFLNARHTLNALFEMGVVPIINENDTVVVKEIKIGDNDTLSAHVVGLIGAELLILLSDIDGFYMNLKDKEPVEEIHEVTEDIIDRAGGSGSDHGTGGMITKIRAAEIIIRFGEMMIIANSDLNNVLIDIMGGNRIGTLFIGKEKSLTSRKKWLALKKTIGSLTIDKGAVDALRIRKKSLLPSGIISVSGEFDMGDMIQLQDETGESIGQGIVNYNNIELAQIRGKRTSEIENILGSKYFDEVIHRDDLIVY